MWYTHVFGIKQFPVYVTLSVIEVVILLSVFDKQKFCYSIYCPLKVVDFFAELRNTTCKLSCSL